MVLEAIRYRRSVREFLPKEVSEITLLEIMRAGKFAPTGKHNAAVEFIVIKKQAMRDKLAQSLKQPFLSQAQALIVPVTDTAKSGWVFQDLSVASENMFVQAAAMGLGSVWKNIGDDQQEEVKQILGVPSNFAIINIVTIGYPKEKLEPHSDSELRKGAIHYEKW